MKIKTKKFKKLTWNYFIGLTILEFMGLICFIYLPYYFTIFIKKTSLKFLYDGIDEGVIMFWIMGFLTLVCSFLVVWIIIKIIVENWHSAKLMALKEIDKRFDKKRK